MKSVKAAGAPAPIGPYSQGVISGGVVYCSGQIGLNPEGTLISENFEIQARQALDNLTAVIRAAGSDWHHVVRAEVFLLQLEDFGAFNAIYTEYCVAGVFPARITVGVAALPKGARIEISCIAALG